MKVTPKKQNACSNRQHKKREAAIEYFYLDLKTCDRCIGTDAVLEEVVKELTPALQLAGYRVSYNKIEIASEQSAVQHRFVSSPTIRVNGHDICPDVQESDCGCCGEISGTQVNCRVFEHDGRFYTVPPKEMLAETILKAVFSPPETDDCGCYELPENLREFFKGKRNKAFSGRRG